MEPKLTIDSPAEYALYWMWVHYPISFMAAETFSCRMLAQDQEGARRVKALLAAR